MNMNQKQVVVNVEFKMGVRPVQFTQYDEKRGQARKIGEARIAGFAPTVEVFETPTGVLPYCARHPIPGERNQFVHHFDRSPALAFGNLVRNV